MYKKQDNICISTKMLACLRKLYPIGTRVETEHVQFEDDEYYYYVTAVPKMHIPEQEKEIKRITSETLPLPVDDLEETEETQDN